MSSNVCMRLVDLKWRFGGIGGSGLGEVGRARGLSLRVVSAVSCVLHGGSAAGGRREEEGGEALTEWRRSGGCSITSPFPDSHEILQPTVVVMGVGKSAVGAVRRQKGRTGGGRGATGRGRVTRRRGRGRTTRMPPPPFELTILNFKRSLS